MLKDIEVILPERVEEAEERKPMGEGPYELIIVGAGEGAKAALSAYHYLLQQ